MLLARHSQRPFTLDYLQLAFANLVELHGDRQCGDDPALGLADRVLMLEKAVYSVASPEAATSILWKDGRCGAAAAEALGQLPIDELVLQCGARSRHRGAFDG